MDTLVEMRNIYKFFGGLCAVNNVSLSVARGEVIGLVGDNAAGKSTLIKILSGAVSLDSGKLFLDGKETHIRNPASSRALGIETVYQQFALVDNLPVYSNVFLGRLIKRKILGAIPILDKRKMQDETLQVIDLMGIQFDSVKRKVSDLSGVNVRLLQLLAHFYLIPGYLFSMNLLRGLPLKKLKKFKILSSPLKKKGLR